MDPSIKQSDFDRGIIRARRYRNRRIGEFLKELRLTEGRGTGIPTMLKALKTNGSVPPKFDTNEPDRIYFLVEFFIHPEFKKDTDEGGVISGVIDREIGREISGEIGGEIILTKRQKEVLELIRENNTITIDELANVLGIKSTSSPFLK